MRRCAAPCPISATWSVEDFLDKYEAAAIAGTLAQQASAAS